MLIAVEDRPQRVTDLAGGQGARGDLVRERLEQVEVPAIDERDLDVGALQVLGRLQAAEAPADDDDSMHPGETRP